MQRMDEYQQIVAMVKSGNLTVDKLQGLLKMANDQLTNYEKAKKLIDDAGKENWTFELYQEALRIGSGGSGSDITRAEWDQMFPANRQQSFENFLRTISDGQQTFEKVKSCINDELSNRGIRFSGKKDDSKSGCYIATEVYGSYDAPEVIRLREFRDKHLMPSGLGRFTIMLYYQTSPYIAFKLKPFDRIKGIIRHLLDYFVILLRG